MQKNALFFKNAQKKCIEIRQEIDFLFQKKKYDQIKKILVENRDEITVDNDLSLLYYLVEIYYTEKNNFIESDIFSAKHNISEVIENFTALKFKLRRIEFDMPDAVSEFFTFVVNKHLSIYVIQYAVQFGCFNANYVFDKIKEGVR